jgi:hypothetical protein
MGLIDIVPHRLANQRLTAATFTRPAEAAAWLGVVQAQVYDAGQWGLGLRLLDSRQAGLEQAVAERSLVRSWMLRGTLHFAAAEDARWILALVARTSAPRYASYNRRLELDEATFARSHDALTKALQGGAALTRKEISSVLEASGISTQGLRQTFLLYRAALEGLICFGPFRGKQPTFVLLEEWLPPAAPKTYEESLGELAWRYFRSHGPATFKDYRWWSGLTAGEARAGLELVKARLAQESIGDQVYWFSPELPASGTTPPRAYLLPVYDEYIVAYSDRGAVMDMPSILRQVGERGSLGPFIVLAGRVVGAWKRELYKGRVAITLQPFARLSETEEQAVSAAAHRYADFLDLEPEITYVFA